MMKQTLMPGDYIITNKKVVLSTILGSCVSICLYNKKAGWSGMNHFVLPTGQNESHDPGRYGRSATEVILRNILTKDPNTSHYKVGIYGAGSVLDSLDQNPHLAIGQKNYELAVKLLKQYNFGIHQKVVGGKHGLQIYFNTESGHVDHRYTSDIDTSTYKQALRMLVIDSSALICSTIEDLFRTNMGLLVFSSTAQLKNAFSDIESIKPDVILADIQCNKQECIPFIETLSKQYKIPCIVFSNMDNISDEEQFKCNIHRVTEFLDKKVLNFKDSEQLKMSILNSLQNIFPGILINE